jgi:hypothetical protein
MNRDYKAEHGGQRPAVAEDIPPSAVQRPDCFEFAMSFLGDPEETVLRQYIADLEARAALAQPEPEVAGPSDEDLEALAQELDDVPVQAVFAFARAVLARWGRPAIQPIPVAERLPGVEDCDGCGNCWWFRQGTRDGFPFWWLGCGDNVSTHWLPAHALPVPTSQEVL